MKEISNKVLMYVLFVAVVVSVGSMMYTFGAISKTTNPTGMATLGGTVDLEIALNYVVNVTDTTIDYGTGYLNEVSECELESNASKPSCWTESGGPIYGVDGNMTFENIGGDDIRVLVAGETAAEVLGAVGSPTFTFSCSCESGNSVSGVTVDGTPATCCNDLDWDGTDSGVFSTKLKVVSGSVSDNANTGTITFSAGVVV